jgi:hypothetical protein
MTSVEQFIEYLKTLPPETTVEVAVAVDCNWSSYTRWEDLELPDSSSPTVSDNLDFGENTPFLRLGRT